MLLQYHRVQWWMQNLQFHRQENLMCGSSLLLSIGMRRSLLSLILWTFVIITNSLAYLSPVRWYLRLFEGEEFIQAGLVASRPRPIGRVGEGREDGTEFGCGGREGGSLFPRFLKNNCGLWQCRSKWNFSFPCWLWRFGQEENWWIVDPQLKQPLNPSANREYRPSLEGR